MSTRPSPCQGHTSTSGRSRKPFPGGLGGPAHVPGVLCPPKAYRENPFSFEQSPRDAHTGSLTVRTDRILEREGVNRRIRSAIDRMPGRNVIFFPFVRCGPGNDQPGPVSPQYNVRIFTPVDLSRFVALVLAFCIEGELGLLEFAIWRCQREWVVGKAFRSGAAWRSAAAYWLGKAYRLGAVFEWPLASVSGTAYGLGEVIGPQRWPPIARELGPLS